jgi:hypothetical protein
MEGDEGRVIELGLAQAVDEVEAGGRESEQRPVLSVPPGQRVRHDVRSAWLVLDGEIEPQQLANLMMLQNSGEALVQ